MTEKRFLTRDEARALADTIRATHPEKAAEIDAELARAREDDVNIAVSMRYRLEKYHGEMKPGDAPYEVIEGRG